MKKHDCWWPWITADRWRITSRCQSKHVQDVNQSYSPTEGVSNLLSEHQRVIYERCVHRWAEGEKQTLLLPFSEVCSELGTIKRVKEWGSFVFGSFAWHNPAVLGLSCFCPNDARFTPGLRFNPARMLTFTSEVKDLYELCSGWSDSGPEPGTEKTFFVLGLSYTNYLLSCLPHAAVWPPPPPHRGPGMQR